MAKKPHIALLGNPNSGKSSLFNLLTGLNQKVGNLPGVTVEKKIGKLKIQQKTECNVIDRH
jgi:ferrous iron transport protein B